MRGGQSMGHHPLHVHGRMMPACLGRPAPQDSRPCRLGRTMSWKGDRSSTVMTLRPTIYLPASTCSSVVLPARVPHSQ